MTVSITWMTPFEVATSAATIFESFTKAEVPIVNFTLSP